MIVIPAVDIKNGKCVRLFQGEMDKETVFSQFPHEMAKRWEDEGASLIHLVDLDGAVAKKPVNKDAVQKILDTVNTPVQLGGGIRDMETIRMYIDMGVSKIIIGTEAIKNPSLVEEAAKAFPGCIIIGIDARGGMVAVDGWTETTETTAVELAKQFESKGVAAINFTDIHRDGMQSGPNIEETRKLAESVSIPIVASGGVSCLGDIKNLLKIESYGVTGVISGRALYEGTLNLKEALALTAAAS